jgi:chromosomal replication initiation ATPase DnaA
LKNAKIGELFGVSYSSVSHSVRAAQAKLKKDTKLRAKLDAVNSQFKI